MNCTEFIDRVIVVTGGASGIGAACAELFAGRGGKVVVLDPIVKDNTDNVEYLKCDVSKLGDLEVCVNYIVKTYKRVDCLINNAGIHPPPTSIESYSTQEFNELLNLNLTSAYSLTRLVYDELKKTQGTVINVSSMVGVLGQRHAVGYCASKAGTIGMTKSLAIEAAEFGIRVNSVSPSNVMTDSMNRWLSSMDDPKQTREQMREQIESVQILKRMADPKEIANVIFFLASESSSFITGQNIEVDGGASLDY